MNCEVLTSGDWKWIKNFSSKGVFVISNEYITHVCYYTTAMWLVNH